MKRPLAIILVISSLTLLFGCGELANHNREGRDHRDRSPAQVWGQLSVAPLATLA